MKVLSSFWSLAVWAALFVASASLDAQDDSYHPIRFINESDKGVEITVWNPRDERKPDHWKVEAGKTLDLVDQGGKTLNFGIYSSLIRVNDSAEVKLVAVSTRAEDGKRILTWTSQGFKKPAESP